MSPQPQIESASMLTTIITSPLTRPQGFWGTAEKGYLYSGSLGVLVIILGELESQHIVL